MTESESTKLGNIDKAVGENLKRLRESKGLSQAEFARLMTDANIPNFHQTTVARVEKGTRSLRVAEAVAIAQSTGISVQRLLTSSRANQLQSVSDELSDLQAALLAELRKVLERRFIVALELDRLVPLNTQGTVDVDLLDRLELTSGLVEEVEERLERTDPARVLATAISMTLGEVEDALESMSDLPPTSRAKLVVASMKNAVGEDG